MAAFENVALNAAADAIAALLDGGTLQFQTSADAETATVAFGNPAFGAAVAGVATANAITPDSSAAGGVTTKFVCRTSAAALVVAGTAGSAGTEDMVMDNATISAGVTVEVDGFTVSVTN